MIDWKKVPKVELHLHLEGAAQPEFIRQLAHEKKIDLGRIFDGNGNYVFKDFVDFLRVYEAATQVLKTPEDFARLMTAVLKQSADDGVIYTEIFIAPDFCGGGDLVAWKEYIAAMAESTQTAEKNQGIRTRLIPTCVRHFGPDKARQSARLSAEVAGDLVTGFGMGGDEGYGNAKDYAYAFDMAREAGLRLTTHAGEFGGPQSVWDSLKHLRVERIGHGVRSIEDDTLVKHLAAEQIVLEVNPGSNVKLGVYPDLMSHPIVKLRDAGVPVTVSTDDPPFFDTSMTDEYDGLSTSFGWGLDDMKAINMTAIDAAFCDEDIKAALKGAL